MAEFTKSDIVAALWNADIDMDDGPRWGYSGRNMYGKTCFGFVGTMEDYGNFLLGLAEIFYDQTEDFDASRTLAQEFSSRVTTDSMGYSTIFYFPGIQVLENE